MLIAENLAALVQWYVLKYFPRRIVFAKSMATSMFYYALLAFTSPLPVEAKDSTVRDEAAYTASETATSTAKWAHSTDNVHNVITKPSTNT